MIHARLIALLATPALLAQDPAALRALLRDTPAIPVEQVPMAARMSNAVSMGTVSSVAADRDGAIYVFQRGDQADPVIVVNTEGRLLRSWGRGMFQVPHSIRVDPQGSIWTVDAGSSRLLKFSPQGEKLQEISVGEVAVGDKCAFPTLCGTTDIAFSPTGRIFVSDGYGNARILEYSHSGARLRVWGSAGTGPSQFRIPHGIAAGENVVFVADRENARIQRFDLEGRYLGEWTHLGRPYALKISGGALWVAITTLEQSGRAPWLLQVDPASGKLLGQVQAPGPHSIDVTRSGELFASGCCGGSAPTSFSWFRK